MHEARLTLKSITNQAAFVNMVNLRDQIQPIANPHGQIFRSCAKFLIMLIPIEIRFNFANENLTGPFCSKIQNQNADFWSI